MTTFAEVYETTMPTLVPMSAALMDRGLSWDQAEPVLTECANALRRVFPTVTAEGIASILITGFSLGVDWERAVTAECREVFGE
jgi:hypothetical protein